jgi:hypothetical protein
VEIEGTRRTKKSEEVSEATSWKNRVAEKREKVPHLSWIISLPFFDWF